MIGVNTFGLAHKMTENLPGTFQAIAEAGFNEVELLMLLMKKQGKIPVALAAKETLPKLIAEANKNGLQVRSVHIFGGMLCFLIPRKKLVRYFEDLYHQYGIETFVFSGMFKDAKGARKWARFMKQISEMISTDKIRILLHNHSQEFEMLQIGEQNVSALDYFFSLTGEKVGMQLDIGWAGICTDEVKVAKKYAERIVSLHLKDFAAGTKGNFKNENMPKERFCAIGDGEIRTAEVLAIRDTFPNFNGSIVIDQDHSTTDILDDMRIGYQNIRTML